MPAGATRSVSTDKQIGLSNEFASFSLARSRSPRLRNALPRQGKLTICPYISLHPVLFESLVYVFLSTVYTLSGCHTAHV